MNGDLLLLHGFLGAPASFRALDTRGARVFAPLLLGHSGTEIRAGREVPKTTTEAPPELPEAPGPHWALDHGGFLREVDRLASWVRDHGFTRGSLLGYSLGARLGLGLLARHPDLFVRAILVSVHPGLESEADRAERLASDLGRCRALQARGVADFVDAWERQELFASQQRLSREVLETQRGIRLSHSALGLARSLLDCGLAAMPSYTEVLGSLSVPLTLWTGELDEKFSALARSLAARHPTLARVSVPDSGHNVLLERPELLSEALG